MLKKLLPILTISLSLSAATCQYEAKNSSMTWSAFKTYSKLAVNGTFDKMSLKSSKADSLNKMLISTSIKIDTASVDTKNSARDKTLNEYFFSKLSSSTIDAKIVSIDDKGAVVNITLNGVSLDIPFKKSSSSNSNIEYEGHIDLGDFNALLALKSINQACYELHSGKTWSHVALKFSVDYKQNCK
jgi:polyisoprenoid-binding protein YceI